MLKQNVIVILILSYQSYAINRLDKKIINETWTASPEFCKQSNLDYMILKIGDISYLIAGDAKGLLYNTPIDLKLSYLSEIDDKVKYKAKINKIKKDYDANDEITLPFPEDCEIVFDRINHTLSITNNDTLYGFFNKTTSAD